MSDQADGLRRLVRTRSTGARAEGDARIAVATAEPPAPPRSRLAALFAAIAARWGRRSRADCSA